MADMVTGGAEPDRPGAGEAHRPAARRRQDRMGRVLRQLRDMALDGRDRSGTEGAKFRPDPRQDIFRLGAAAHRLIERLAAGDVQRAQTSASAERPRRLAEIVDADQALVALQPLPAWVARQPPGEREIGQELRAVGRGRPALCHHRRLAVAPRAQQVAETVKGDDRIVERRQGLEEPRRCRLMAEIVLDIRFVEIEHRMRSGRAARAIDDGQHLLVALREHQARQILAPEIDLPRLGGNRILERAGKDLPLTGRPEQSRQLRMALYPGRPPRERPLQSRDRRLWPVLRENGRNRAMPDQVVLRRQGLRAAELRRRRKPAFEQAPGEHMRRRRIVRGQPGRLFIGRHRRREIVQRPVQPAKQLPEPVIGGVARRGSRDGRDCLLLILILQRGDREGDGRFGIGKVRDHHQASGP